MRDGGGLRYYIYTNKLHYRPKDIYTKVMYTCACVCVRACVRAHACVCVGDKSLDRNVAAVCRLLDNRLSILSSESVVRVVKTLNAQTAAVAQLASPPRQAPLGSSFTLMRFGGEPANLGDSTSAGFAWRAADGGGGVAGGGASTSSGSALIFRLPLLSLLLPLLPLPLLPLPPAPSLPVSNPGSIFTGVCGIRYVSCCVCVVTVWLLVCCVSNII